jgi:hypothetical protein
MSLLNEMLHDAAVADRERVLADGLRHADHDGVRGGALAAWRQRRAAARASAVPAPHPARRPVAPAVPAVAQA